MAKMHGAAQRYAVQTGYGLTRYLTDHDTWADIGDASILLFDNHADAMQVAIWPTSGTCCFSPIACPFPPDD